jgi:hypothetical protein
MKGFSKIGGAICSCFQATGHWNNHHTNSSSDPGVAATLAVKPTSNSRQHPRAALKETDSLDKDAKRKAWHGMLVMKVGLSFHATFLDRV